jgi:hypothetical protein
MSQALDLREDPGSQLLRMAQKQCRAAAAELRKPEPAPGTPPQDRSRVRAKIKRLRAILALARDGFSRADFRREVAWLRRQSLLLAPARDAEARQERLRRLRRRARPVAATALDRMLLADASPPPPQSLDRAALARSFENRAARLPRLLTRRQRKRDVLRRAEQSRKRARRALEAALEHPSIESLHLLRRRVKRAGLQLEILGKSAPKGSPSAAKLARLALDLGEEHDLELLLAWLPTGVQAAALSGEEEAAVRLSLMRRRDLLRSRSLSAAKRALGSAGAKRS